jgi:glycerol-3-phosphate dehydrogenase
MSETILVIGAGSWGTAIAQTLAGYDHGHSIMIWDSNDAILEEIHSSTPTNATIQTLNFQKISK